MTDEEISEYESTIIEPLLPNRGHRTTSMALEVVEEEDSTPGTTPSPSTYLPDIHHNQKVL